MVIEPRALSFGTAQDKVSEGNVMNKITPKTLKGFRDFLPKEARKRQFVIEALKSVFESYGFEPIETPALEYEDILLGKYGEEGDKLMYRFEDNGQRRVALRYDQTVPLARVASQFSNELPIPFKRYQMQNVWRAENTQKGRFREFLQCDIDTVGSSNALADAEIIACAYDGLKALGFSDFKILVNDRAVFKDLSKGTITAIDKLKKIGKEEVVEELVKRGEYDSSADAEKILIGIEQEKPTAFLSEIIENAKRLGVPENVISFNPFLARGLDYYTSTIIEVEAREYTAGSLGGGGRYDNLIGIFEGRTMPSVGFAFGFDRIIEAMEELNLFPEAGEKPRVLVSVFSPDMVNASIKTVKLLRSKGISTELYTGNSTDKLEKQIKYAVRKNLQYMVIVGPNELEKGAVTLKNLKTGSQSIILLEQLPKDIL